MEQPHRVSHLRELAVVFGTLGLIGFGGPAAHVALMRRAVVERRQWIGEQRFTDLLGITSLLPGPNSTELAMHVGLDRAGRLGLLVAGLAFIVPAALIVLAIAVIYVAVGASPAGSAVLYLLKPVIIVNVAVAIARIGRTALAGPLRLVVGAAVLVLALLGVHELLLLAGGAVVLAVARNSRSALGRLAHGVVALPAIVGAGGATAVGLPVLFLTFLKIGAVLYGSGYVLVAFLRADFVERLGWITDRQLLDAVALGQVTPDRSSPRPLSLATWWPGYPARRLPRSPSSCRPLPSSRWQAA